MSTGPIILIDEDDDDQELIREIMDEMQLCNQLIFFEYGHQVIDYLNGNNPLPFIIICEVNLPKMDGFTLRQKILDDPDMAARSVPFIFWSASISEEQIECAYKKLAHGFFVKEPSYAAMKKSFSTLIEYWSISKIPKSV